ncbi:pantetheine-phosphate adenylyltransferase [Rhodopseudomonas julia]|uniref:Phosphopantetheine adenylyltransferase n=1 Tax=Rhodopseudomonas julia TaxID=200617 RepID=A0ABU0C980_9BRAD|nr:pantetheine-phosphate adenylyltransferase [Rhodopseudomonas julia]MDQ0327093.1 pantetheine-phosphate adenylyltransferase [Rhodopseudomonas julia]
MIRTALYPGSFDPLTNGHIDILQAAFGLVDRVIVAVGRHPTKSGLLDIDKRIALIEEVAGPLAESSEVTLEVLSFDNLVVDLAQEVGATILIRGLRDGTDLDYEMQMVGMNRTMAHWLQTVFVPASPHHRHITATLVRQIAAMGGDIGPFVPASAADAVRVALAER